MKYLLGLALSLIVSLSVPTFAAEEPTETGLETGTLIWSDGTRYVGGVLDGKRSGKGTIYWEDGTRFVGNFKNDLREGPGSMILPDGTVYNGYFRGDKLIEAPAEPGEPMVDADLVTTTAVAPEQESSPPVQSADPAPATPQPATPPSAEPVVATETAPVADPGITQITDAVKQELISTIDLWAAAWSEQNVPQYLANYADNFEVPGKQSRRAWEGLRRSRLTRPAFIKVGINYERFEIVEPNVARVTFNQTYQSDVYRDQTTKTLTLIRESPFWKILKEETD